MPLQAKVTSGANGLFLINVEPVLGLDFNNDCVELTVNNSDSSDLWDSRLGQLNFSVRVKTYDELLR